MGKEFNFALVLMFAIILIRELVVNRTEAGMVVFDYAAFLILPLVISFQSRKLQSLLPKILLVFLGGCVLNATVNLGYAIFRGIINNESGINFWYFTYDFLAEPFGIQPIYLGMYYVFGVLILVTYGHKIKSNILRYLVFILLVISIFLLAARNAIVSLVILLPIYMLVIKKLSFKKLLIGVAILGACFAIAIQNPVIKNRIFKANKKGNVYSGTSLRTSIWQGAVDAAKANIVWGSGEKKGTELLLNEFEVRGLEIPLKYKYHSHNQFLQTLTQYGLVGLIFMIFTFLSPLARTFFIKNYLGLFWGLLVLLASMTESIFTRQWGIFSFAFFTCLFFLSPNESDDRP